MVSKSFAVRLRKASTPQTYAYSVLGDETRYRIVRALAESEKEMCVCEFDLVLDVSESAVSHAFRELYDKGLVQREKRGRWRYYETTDRAEAILDALEGSG